MRYYLRRVKGRGRPGRNGFLLLLRAHHRVNYANELDRTRVINPFVILPWGSKRLSSITLVCPCPICTRVLSGKSMAFSGLLTGHRSVTSYLPAGKITLRGTTEGSALCPSSQQYSIPSTYTLHGLTYCCQLRAENIKWIIPEMNKLCFK